MSVVGYSNIDTILNINAVAVANILTLKILHSLAKTICFILIKIQTLNGRPNKTYLIMN